MRKYDRNVKEKKVPIALIVTIAIILILAIICIPILKKQNAHKKVEKNSISNEENNINNNENNVKEDPKIELEPRKGNESFKNKENMITAENADSYGYNKEKTIIRNLNNENGIDELIFNLKNIDQIMIIEQIVNEKGDLVDGKIKETIDAKGKDHLIIYTLIPEISPNTKIVAVGSNGKRIEMLLKSKPGAEMEKAKKEKREKNNN